VCLAWKSCAIFRYLFGHRFVRETWAVHPNSAVVRAFIHDADYALTRRQPGPCANCRDLSYSLQAFEQAYWAVRNLSAGPTA
jgi:hypothetical protein